MDETNTLSENIKTYRYRIGLDQKKTYATVNMLYDSEDTYNQDLDEDQDEVFAVEALEEKHRKPRTEGICPKLLVTDKCWDRSCCYSHNPRLLAEEKKRLMMKWSPNSSSPLTQPINAKTETLKTSPLQTKHNQTGNYNKNESKQNKATKPGLHILEVEDEELLQPEADVSSDVEDCNLISAFLQLTTPAKYYAATHRQATVNIPGTEEKKHIMVALFDSGASSNNYISKNCIAKNNLEGELKRCEKKVKVANGVVVSITDLLALTVTFTDSNEKRISVTLEFYVLDGLSLELVIGLPSIIQHFRGLFVDMINSCSEDLTLIESSSLLGETIKLNWEENLVCEEETMIPQPESFHFLECSRDEAIEKFLEELPSRIDPDFSRETAILDFLRRVCASLLGGNQRS